jgi:hypothetical protein
MGGPITLPGCIGAFLLTAIIVALAVVIEATKDVPAWRDATSIEVAEHLGVRKDAEYSADVGRLSNSYEGLSGSTFLGTGSTEGLKTTPMITFSVNLEDGTSHIIVVPYGTVKFIQKEVRHPSVSFELNNTEAGSLARWRDNELIPTDNLEGIDAIEIIARYYEGAVITLSPEEYERVLTGT